MFRALPYLFIFLCQIACYAETSSYPYLEGPSIYYWQTSRFVNFGDYVSLKLVERILGGQIPVCQSKDSVHKLLAIGSILVIAKDRDIVWGTGMNGKVVEPERFKLEQVDIRAVRGPKTRDFIMHTLQRDCPEVYGDPALLLPYFFPEFKRAENPSYEYLIVPHYSELEMFPKEQFPNVVYPTDPWQEVIRKIIDSKFVIASSLHGIIVAEDFGVPARWLRISDNETTFKYEDYYLGTNRQDFFPASSVEEALELGGEAPFDCDLEKLYAAFPFEAWPTAEYIKPKF